MKKLLTILAIALCLTALGTVAEAGSFYFGYGRGGVNFGYSHGYGHGGGYRNYGGYHAPYRYYNHTPYRYYNRNPYGYYNPYRAPYGYFSNYRYRAPYGYYNGYGYYEVPPPVMPGAYDPYWDPYWGY